MRLSLNGPPGQATGVLVKLARPPDKLASGKPSLHPPDRSQANTAMRQRIVTANQAAQAHFPSQDEQNKLKYQKYDLGSPILAPVVKPAAKATLNMSYLF
ncbi:MAG: hypothetical protein CMI31_03315 [Opitutae bacterium]|nr:hypothetical protein [Opitutae bacterium]|tara:strand:+ start:921 stop:1220 length:300 start_codon:yes stop_codon:yes gene_type:complete